MDLITCPHCLYSFTPEYGQKSPPWCRRCGGDLAARPIGSAEPVEELVALTAAPAPSHAPAAAGRAGRWANHKPRPTATTTAAGTTPLKTASLTTADTPPPADDRRPRRRRTREATHETFDYEAAVREAGFESTRPSLTCYGFAGLCLLLPLLTLGGGIPCALGFAGAGACVQQAHSHGRPFPLRLVTCVGIVGLVWGLFIALLLCAVMAARGLVAPK